MKKIKLLVFLAFTSMAFVACNNSNGNNGGAVPVAHSYGYQNGTCWDYTTNTPATSPMMCTSAINGANTGNYFWQNGACFSRMNMSQPVASTLCTNINGLNNGLISKQCNGAYIWPSDPNTQRWCTANGQINNCQGYMMIEVATGQNVNCI